MKLKEKIFNELKKIRNGEVRTYKEIALKFNTSPRAVAKIISTNKNPILIPCHRVIRSNGDVGGYTYDGKLNPEMKKNLLEKEGHKIINGRILFN
jgi:methylated-DNA-[protein]-cysteine S-methyltransferase